MAFIKVGNKVLKCGGKVVTDDLVLLVKLAGDGKTLTVIPTKDISATLTRYMLVLTPASGSATEVNIGNTGTYDLSSLHGSVQDGKYALSVYAVLSSGNTAPFGSIEYYVLAPCNTMTLRFKFSKNGYNPVNAGVGSAGTWNHLIGDVWDWTNTNPDWHEAFKGAFAADDNEVEVIGAGDTSGVTNIEQMFAGNFTGNVNGSNYSLTSRNNIVFCVPFNVNGCADFESCFCGTCLKNVVKFHYNNTLESVQMFSLFADTYVTKADIDLYGAVAIISALFARCERLKFFSLKGCENVTKCVSCFYRCRQELKEIVINGELTKVTSLQTFAQNAFLVEKIHIKAPQDNLNLQATLNGCRLLTELFFEVGKPSRVDYLFNGCYVLKEFPPIDTSICSNFQQMMNYCENAETIPNYDVSSATNVKQMCANMFKAKYGILEMYNKLLARGSAITDHTDCFKYCGRDTPEGQAALAQIPTDWGGTMST